MTDINKNNFSTPKPREQKTQAQTSNSNHTSSTTLYIIICSAVCFAASIAIWLMFFRETKREIIVSEPIPYIWNLNFQKELNTFVFQPDHKEVLVVYGPSGFGKTRGLKVFEDNLRAKDFLVFDFDFKLLSNYAAIDDFVSYVRSVVINSLKLIDGRINKNQETLKAVQLVEALTSIEQPIKDVKIDFKDQLTHRLVKGFISISESFKTHPEISLQALFEAFDALRPLSPVVVIHNLNHLLNIENDIISNSVASFWRICEDFSRDYRSLPIIIEISDQVPLLQHYTKETIHMLYVNDFDVGQAKNILVDQNIFNPSDYQFALEKFGGHGKSFATFYDKLKEGSNANSAYSFIEKQYRDTVIKSILIDASKKDIHDRLSFLKKTVNWHMIPIQVNPNLAYHFMNWKVISLYNLTHCSLSSKLAEKVVIDVLNKIK
ncbi:hypothetical protein M9Y10_009905 [Tritrichomonas musculus]|uniref:ATPase domain-containing protein n=1 Tax=Tritrichomonas musculus TaxID=1915356 RepID=A0ABR2IRS4_9EUKA